MKNLNVAAFVFIVGCVRGADVETQLIESLFINYDKDARPNSNVSYSIPIYVHTKLIQILEMDEKAQLIKVKLWISQIWKNEYLRWNPSDWAGIERLEIPPSMVWLPDLTLYNSDDTEESTLSTYIRTDVVLQSDGQNEWYSPVTFRSTCAMSIKHFPFDRQNCTLKFGSWNNHISRIDTQLDKPHVPILTSEYIINSEWHVEIAYTERKVIGYGFTDPFVDIDLHILLHRKPFYHVLNTIAPGIVLVILMLLSMLLPPHSGERMSVSITIFLAVTIFQQLVSDSLPRNSDSFPRLIIFYVIMTVQGCLSLCASCLVICMHMKSEEKESEPVPRWISLICFRKIHRCKCKSIDSTDTRQYEADRIVNQGITGENNEAGSNLFRDYLHRTINSPRCDFHNLSRKRQWQAAAAELDLIFFCIIIFASIFAALGIILPSYLQS